MTAQRKWHILIGILAITVIPSLIIWGYKKWNKPGSGGAYTTSSRPTPTVQSDTIIVHAEFPSPEIQLIDKHGNRYNIEPTIMSDQTPYIIHWNGGAENGGFDERIPAKKDRPAGWTSGNPALGRSMKVTFQLEKGHSPAEVFYTLIPH